MGNTRKTVLFIVEGVSDKTALEKIFKSIYKRNKNIEFKFTDGDITSDPSVTINNVKERIYKIILDFMKDKKLNKSDLFQIIQIFDMDGVFVPDDVVEKGNDYRFIYSTEKIYCREPERVIERNKAKRTILNYLLSLQDIEGLSYEMYYMSSNLDHALYNQINLDKDLKQDFADRFYEKFIGKEALFIRFLETDVVNGVPSSFPSSWSYIQEECHSLERHTNLHIYFSRNPLPDGLL